MSAYGLHIVSGEQRKEGAKFSLAVDTLGHLLALHAIPADERDRTQVGRVTQAVQVAFVDQGCGGEAEAEACERDIQLQVAKPSQAKMGSVLLPSRWVAERSFAWLDRVHRLERDCEHLARTSLGLHVVAFVCSTQMRPLSILALSA